MVFKQKTKISRGTTNNNSVRTTVPAPIAQMINVSAGDRIEWTAENIDGNISISISKVVEWLFLKHYIVTFLVNIK